MSRWESKDDLNASNRGLREEWTKLYGHLRELLIILDQKQLTSEEWSVMSRAMKAGGFKLDDLRKKR